MVRRSGSGRTSGAASASTKTWPGITSRSLGEVAVMVAVRGRPRSRPISPNQSSGLISLITPWASVVTSRMPSTMT